MQPFEENEKEPTQIDVAGLRVLVTGGSRGIGAELVKGFASRGAMVAFTFRQSDESATRLLENLSGLNVTAYKFSIENLNEAKGKMTEIWRDIGHLDVLINNAGITKDGPFATMDGDSWNSVININLNGMYNITRSVITRMIRRKKGVIINMSSVAGIVGSPFQVNYSTTKAGIIGFTKALASEYAKYNIRVLCVAPGFIKTDMTNKIPLNVRKELISRIPLTRMGEPKEVSDLVLFLSSDLARYITGQVICIDGGLT